MSLRRTTAVLTLLLAASWVAAADRPKEEKPKHFLLVNKANDIRVISEREEPIVDYFRRNRILVCYLWGVRLKEVLDTEKPLKGFLVSGCSQNDDPDRINTFGARPDIAPLAEPVRKLLQEQINKQPDKERNAQLALILRRDAKEPRLYHVVGCLDREPRGFFAGVEKHKVDGFCPNDLLYEEPKEKK